MSPNILTTKDCQEYMVKNHAQDALERYSPKKEMVPYPGEAEERKELEKICRNAKTPSGWKRTAKYTVGSKTDRDGSDSEGYTGLNYAELRPDLIGGIVRTMYLRDSDHITYNLIEKDGKIVFEDDMSD